MVVCRRVLDVVVHAWRAKEHLAGVREAHGDRVQVSEEQDDGQNEDGSYGVYGRVMPSAGECFGQDSSCALV